MEDREQRDRATLRPHDSRPHRLARHAAVDRDILHLYEADLRSLWNNVARLIGPNTVMVMMQSAVMTAKRTIPSVADLRIGPEGVDVAALRQGDNTRHTDIHALFTLFVAHFLGILYDLTGELIVRKLFGMRVYILFHELSSPVE